MRGGRRDIIKRAALALCLSLGPSLTIHAPARAESCLGVGVPGGAGATDEIMTILREAGKRAGLCVETQRAPANRLATLPLDGWVLTEAEPPDTAGMVALPDPVATFEGVLY